MKIRSDFVTNSSSSSYVIAYKSLPKFDDDTISKYPFLQKYMESAISNLIYSGFGGDAINIGGVFPTLEKFCESYGENYCGSSNELYNPFFERDNAKLKEVYEQCNKLYSEGFNIVVKYVSYHDNHTISFIEELAKNNKNFIVVTANLT